MRKIRWGLSIVLRRWQPTKESRDHARQSVERSHCSWRRRKLEWKAQVPSSAPSRERKKDETQWRWTSCLVYRALDDVIGQLTRLFNFRSNVLRSHPWESPELIMTMKRTKAMLHVIDLSLLTRQYRSVGSRLLLPPITEDALVDLAEQMCRLWGLYSNETGYCLPSRTRV